MTKLQLKEETQKAILSYCKAKGITQWELAENIDDITSIPI